MAKSDKTTQPATPSKPDRSQHAADDLLIREVDDELRAEKLQAWWQRFGSMLVTACVVVVLATVIYQIASSYRQSNAEEVTSLLLASQSDVEKGKNESAISHLEQAIAKDARNKPLAQAQLAALKASGDAKDFSGFDELKQTDDAAYQGLAKLQTNQLDGLDASSLLYPLAAEQQAVKLIAQGKQAEAAKLLRPLLDNSALSSKQISRLQELLQGASN